MKALYVKCEGGPIDELRFENTDRWPAKPDPVIPFSTGRYVLGEGVFTRRRKDKDTGKMVSFEEQAPIYRWEDA